MLTQDSRVQPPALDTYSETPLYNTKAVARQTGVPAPTLRAWERRYGILNPRRGENDYRLYSERDMATITWLRERVESGMTISQAIALLRSIEPKPRRGRRSRPLPETSLTPAALPTPSAQRPAVPPTLAFGDLQAVLLAAFERLDEVSAREVLALALATYTVEEVCLRLITPTLERIGDLWSQGEVSVAVEHFATAVARGQLERLFHLASGAETGPLTLVGCAPGELHELGALTLALLLRRAGLRVAYLGQNVEVEGLLATLAATRPAAVVLSATLPAHVAALAHISRAAQRILPSGPRVFCGGRAFSEQPTWDEAARILPLDAVAAAQEIRCTLSAG